MGIEGDKRKMKLSGELDYRIRYDVEHDLFHAQNVFDDEYITPTFVEYVAELENENAELKKRLSDIELLCYSDGSDGEVLSEIMKYFSEGCRK